MRIPPVTFTRFQPSFINTQGTKRVIEEPKGEDSGLLYSNLSHDTLNYKLEKKRKPTLSYYFELFKQ